MSDFVIQNNGAPVANPLVLAASASVAAQLSVVHNAGAAAAGKLVKIGTSCLMSISDVHGSLDSTGKFAFVVGPSFGFKGDVTIDVAVGNKTVSLDIQFN